MTQADFEAIHENVGYFTWDQFDRFTKAVNDSRTVIPWLRVAGYINTGEHDVRVHTSRDGHVGLPPTWIAAEDLSNMLHELNQWPELEDAANDEYGAWLAWTFTRELETANAKWPHKPRSHRVRYMRCQACDSLTLRWMPPREQGDPAVVKCADKSCSAVMDEKMFTFAAELIKLEQEEHERRRLGKNRGGDGTDRTISTDNLQMGAGRHDPHHEANEGVVAEPG